MPKYVRLIAFFVVAYAFSPIDLIPDFIPILGLLDDLIIVPLGISLVIKLTPKNVWHDALKLAKDSEFKPTSNVGAAIVLGVWLLMTVVFVYWITYL